MPDEVDLLVGKGGDVTGRGGGAGSVLVDEALVRLLKSVVGLVATGTGGGRAIDGDVTDSLRLEDVDGSVLIVGGRVRRGGGRCCSSKI